MSEAVEREGAEPRVKGEAEKGLGPRLNKSDVAAVSFRFFDFFLSSLVPTSEGVLVDSSSLGLNSIGAKPKDTGAAETVSVEGLVLIAKMSVDASVGLEGSGAGRAA